MPEPKDELDEVFENMEATPKGSPSREVEVKRSIVDALKDLIANNHVGDTLNEGDVQLLTQVHGYLVHLEGRVNAPSPTPRLRVDPPPPEPVDTRPLEDEVARLVPVFKTARALRDLGYDGPFNGEWTAPLFNAIAEAERRGQR